MFGLSMWEIIVILVVALIVFGPKRLPELGKALGRGLAEFRKASNELRSAIEIDPDSTQESYSSKKLPQAEVKPSVEIVSIDTENVNRNDHDEPKEWQG